MISYLIRSTKPSIPPRCTENKVQLSCLIQKKSQLPRLLLRCLTQEFFGSVVNRYISWLKLRFFFIFFTFVCPEVGVLSTLPNPTSTPRNHIINILLRYPLTEMESHQDAKIVLIKLLFLWFSSTTKSYPSKSLIKEEKTYPPIRNIHRSLNQL